ncbi:hypothetical protein RD792_016415 [Penstemon davidsonii]|uniref:Amidase domain-containing protein n=1 Tax=Penstemon davidsonii TaxID=160366 RepID=A0ABR0CL50_9LAMI|nr:hypothetical protein RD792_016415 [Penstemon davidsonii]
MESQPSIPLLSFIFIIFVVVFSNSYINTSNALSIKEATVEELQTAFEQNQLTLRQLTEFYLNEIQRVNPILKGVIEVNPDALYLAEKVDRERKAKTHGSYSRLHGIPILLKDNIGTKDKLNNSAGSFALVGSVVAKDAGVVKRLREAGAIVIGKASLSEWTSFRSFNAPNGWSARGGQGKWIGNIRGLRYGGNITWETDGSILCPSSFNSIVGIKPTVGLTSRAGVIPISPRQDTIGPICRTVSHAVNVLDAIVGFDYNDAKATRRASN